MPYPGISSPSVVKKIDSCVEGVLADPRFKPKKGRTRKESAIAICRARIQNNSMEVLTRSGYKLKSGYDFGKGKLVSDVEVFKEGIYRGIEWTRDELDLIAENFKKLKETADFDPPVRIGHRSDSSVENAKNVIGYVEDVYVKIGTDGKARLYNSWDIVDSSALEDIKAGKYRKRSAEIGPYDNNNGEIFDLALWGVGLVDIPAVEGMAELALFSKDESDKIPETKEESEKFAKKLRVQAHELLEQDKFSTKDVKLIGKALKALDALLRAAADKEDWWDVSWISGILSSLKSRVTMETSDGEILMSKKSKDEKFDAACMREKIKQGMSEEEAKKACYSAHDKEDEDTEDTEDAKEESEEEEDSVEDTATDEGGEEKTDETDDSKADSEESEESEESADKADSEESEESDKEEFSKGEEKVSIAKSELETLTKRAQEAEDKSFDIRLNDLVTKAVIPAAKREVYAQFAKTLSPAQKEDFLKLLSGQPPIVELDKKKGKQGSETQEDIEKHEAKSKAEQAVHSHLVRSGYTDEQATEILNKNNKKG